jgi:uncharacterized protein YkwD
VPRQRRAITAIASIAAWMLITGAPASASDCPNTQVQMPGLSQAAIEGSITCLINQERVAFGLPPVQANPSLRQAALSHSNEMVQLGYFEHTSPAGLTFVDRIKDTGYTQGAQLWEVGENLVWGSGPLSTPRSLVTSWMNSPPHRENLLRPQFRDIGVAAVAGTPENGLDLTGVTVSSEYGDRSFAKIARPKAKKKRKRHRSKPRRGRRR